LLAEAGIDVPPTLTFVAADFERDDLSGTLRQAGFRADLAVCVSWIGVSMYLTDDAVSATLRTVAGFAAGSCLCLNYRVPLTMLDPIEQAISEVMEMRVAAMGEPWLSAFEPAQLQKQLLELGFSSAESATPEELNARYFARRKDGLRTGGGVRLLCART
jgi:methyltransferase (TIGR00027 family)